jgi:hypothetical protein
MLDTLIKSQLLYQLSYGDIVDKSLIYNFLQLQPFIFFPNVSMTFARLLANRLQTKFLCSKQHPALVITTIAGE